jgi:hypothetical protein
MGKTAPKKSFDAVAWMREARSRLDAELSGKSFEEEKQYIRDRLAKRTARSPKSGQRKGRTTTR